MGYLRGLCAVALGLLASCTHPASGPAGERLAQAPRPRHAQIFRAATTEARLAVFEKFKARNRAPWKLLRATDDVDAFRLFVRRAALAPNENGNLPPLPASTGDARQAESDALAFVTDNADLLGLTPAEVVILEVAAKALTPGDGPTPRTRWEVRLHAHLPMKGFESFESVATYVEILVYVDDDRRIRFFDNGSRIHPRLALDTRPDLEPDDPRVIRNVIDRELFVAVADPRHPEARVRQLERISIGRVKKEDVVAKALTIQASPGPMGAWMTYVLAYAIRVGRGDRWFRFVVDADTGDLLDDAAVPIVNADDAPR